MKQFFQKPILSIFALILISHFSVTKADTASDAETILQLGRKYLPWIISITPGHTKHKSLDISALH